jgi:SagB-type dehydrogenase family enzyme
MNRLVFRNIRKVIYAAACCLSIVFISFISNHSSAAETTKRVKYTGARTIQLPAPTISGTVNLEEAIGKRRSVRQFADKPINFVQMGQLAWAGQGVTDKESNLRAAPSAGALYPIDLYFVTYDGTFVYHPENHSLVQTQQGDNRKKLSAAADNQQAVAEASCDIVIAGSVKKLSAKYGSKASRFMLLEAGHISENILLEAAAMGLASLPVGDFEIKNVARACELTSDQEPLLIVSIGFPLVQTGKEPGKTVGGPRKALLIVPANDFRDEELAETRRILTEANISITIASSKIGPLTGLSGGLAASETSLDNIHVDDFDTIIFIGGPGASEFFNNQAALTIAREAAAKHKVLAAISIAPTILANAGVLRDLRATAFITQRESIQKSGSHYTGMPVERDGLIITSSGPMAAVPFAQAIVGTLNEIAQRTGKAP